MFTMYGREHLYGTDWELSNASTEAKQDYLPEEVTIYVRGRYLVNALFPVTGMNNRPKRKSATVEPSFFSPWAETSFTVKFSQQSAAKAVCVHPLSEASPSVRPN
jgi:hypothetical protein